MGFVNRLGRFNKQLHVERKSLIIWKTSKLVAESEENGTAEGGRASFCGSLGPMWPRIAPRVDFLRLLGVILEVISEAKSMKNGVEFRCVFGTLFGWVLE